MKRLYDLSYKFYLSNKNPEEAHDLAIEALDFMQQHPVFSRSAEHFLSHTDDSLEQELWDIEFPNPVGVAAGFDKNAEVVDALQSLGFGHVEVGGITLKPQKGNSKPRLFRFPEDEAIINRMGFNNDGSTTIKSRMQDYSLKHPVGLNLGQHEDTLYEETAVDTLNILEDDFDYAVADLSCPNMSASRIEEDERELNRIFTALDNYSSDIPVLMKISPDMDSNSLYQTVEMGLDYDIDGIIATNTSSTGEKYDVEGGLSGEPIRQESTRTVAEVYEIVEDDLPIIGVGGVSSAEDAWEKIVNGASMVQLYTGIVYEGPTVARDINKGLADKLDSNSYEGISEAVGNQV